MNSFFNLDNGFFTFLGKMCDVIVLSLVWMILCIPIITIGPATTALYYASVKVLRGERGYLMSEFFRSFKLNFKRATLIGLILIGVGLFLGMDIYMTTHNNLMDSKLNAILYGVYISLSFLALSVTIYIFPLLSRFDMTIKQLFKAALFMSIRHLPSTICMIIVTICSVLGVSIMVLAGAFVPGVTILIYSLFLERIFKKYMPEESVAEPTGTEDGDSVAIFSDPEDNNK